MMNMTVDLQDQSIKLSAKTVDRIPLQRALSTLALLADLYTLARKNTRHLSGRKNNHIRFVTEALEIDRARDDPSVNLLNQKSEWGQQTLPRLRITPDD